MFSNFPSKKIFNPGGYTRFYFLPVTSVSSFPMIVSGSAQVPVGLKAGHVWYEGYSTPETLVFTEEAVNHANGVYYSVAISGFAPGDKPTLISLLQQLERMRFLVMIRDSLGKMKLAGSPGSPLQLRCDFASGEKRRDLKGFAFKFTGDALFRAPECSF